MEFLKHLAHIYNIYVWFAVLAMGGLMIADSNKLKKINIREAEFIKNIALVYMGAGTFLFFILAFIKAN